MRCSSQLFSLFGLALAACGSSSEAGGPTGGTTTGTGTGGVPLDPPYAGPAGAFSSKTPCPIPAAWPSRSDEIAVAYDTKRGKVFMFPHDAGGRNAELWDWDGTAATFTQRTPCSFVGSLTPVSAKFGAAYDPMRQVIVIHGSVQDLAHDIATFEFDPATGELTDRSPTNPEFNWPRGDSFIFYDTTLASIVIFAGSNLWTWDPAMRTWRIFKSITSMGPRGVIYSMVYDDARHKIYAFGEGSGGTAVSELDLTSGQWLSNTQVPSTEWPALANINMAAFDTTRDKVVLFGTSSAVVHATWEWEPTTGAFHQFVAPTADAMPGSGEVVYDAASKHVTVATLRGADAASHGYLDNVWTWDGASWTAHRPKHASLTWPAQPVIEPNHSSFAVAYDPDRHRTVLFQHARSNEVQGTTLEYDGATWVDRTPPDPAASPPARFGHGMAYDTARRRTVMFGGIAKDRMQDVWEWDGSAGAWTNRTPTPLPPSWPSGRVRPGLTYDASSGNVLMFGGEGEDDTWVWNGAAGMWMRPMPKSFGGGGPFSPRASAVAYDERLGAPLLIDSRFDALEAWSFDGREGSWRQVLPMAGTLPKTKGSILWFFAAAYDRVRGTTLVPGAGATGIELWSYSPSNPDFANETPMTPPSDWPPPMAIDEVGAVAYDSDRSVLEILFRNGRLVERPSR